MNDLIFKNRKLGEIGLDLYFYSIRTLMIYEYEIKYQLSEGLWKSSRYPEGHEDPWIKANLHITQGKSNSRNVVEIGCNIIKNNYNLKKVLEVHTAYDRIRSIGKLSNILSDNIDDLIALLNDGFHESASLLSDEYSDDEFREFMNSLVQSGSSHSLYIIDEDLISRYCESSYTDEEMRDDLGMIQNTMRNTMSLHY